MTRSRWAVWARMPLGTLKPLGLILVLGLFLFSLIALGKVAWDHLRQGDRYTVSFADIECQPPSGQKRVDFLDEVQYVAGMPERFPFLDRDLAQRLARAFARHPLVERVVRIDLLPPRRMQVQLVYRMPVLAVPLAGQTRVVDGFGIVLPARISAQGLPSWQGKVGSSQQSAGEPWGNAAIEGAARTAAYLQPHQDRLHLTQVTTEAGGLVWSTPAGSRILWGRPVGADAAGESSAPLKRDRLLRYCAEHGSLDQPDGRQEHDVRPRREP